MPTISREFFVALKDVVDKWPSYFQNYDFMSEYEDLLEEFEIETTKKMLKTNQFIFNLVKDDYYDYKTKETYVIFQVQIFQPGDDFDAWNWDDVKREFILSLLSNVGLHETMECTFEVPQDMEKDFERIKNLMLGLGFLEGKHYSESSEPEEFAQWHKFSEELYYGSFDGLARWVKSYSNNFEWSVWEFTENGTTRLLKSGFEYSLDEAILKASNDKYTYE